MLYLNGTKGLTRKFINLIVSVKQQGKNQYIKSVTFLSTSKEHVKNEIKKTILFTIAKQNTLKIIFKEKGGRPLNDNYKTIKEETKTNKQMNKPKTNKQMNKPERGKKDLPGLWIDLYVQIHPITICQ